MMSFFRRIVDTITYPLRALLYSPSKLFAPLRWLARLSLPTKVSILAFIFLVVLAVIWLIVSYATATAGAPASVWAKDWWQLTILVVLIPIFLYHTLKFWLQGEISPYPDIDHAWKAGLAELQQQGLDLARTPLFLILGSAGENQERALFHASQVNFNMEAVPHGPAPLHWYGSADGVYLVFTGAGCLSKLAGVARQVADKERVGPSPSPPRAAAPDQPVRQTIVAKNGVPDGAPDTPRPAADERPAPAFDIRGTMQVSTDAVDILPAPGAASEKRVIKLDKDDTIEQARRLQYVCGLIRRQRQPLCPINGILALLPFGLIQRSPGEKSILQGAVEKDLSTVSRVLMLRCPVTALVVGMEEESGFQELVRRLGRERAVSQRFGKGYSLSNPPLPDRLDALCTHACGAFEDWVYAMFRERDALTRTGNTKLYSLLVKIRRDVRGRLADILAYGFGTKDEPDQRSDGLLFSGCYFAGTGDEEDRQAFVKSVFEKLPEQQEEVQWTSSAIRQNEKMLSITQGILVFCTAMIVLLVAFGVYKVVFQV
ncbi:MAG: hypothetical protein HQ567_19030 [Candidatus Nealsonbacteria bacterium]|nr:hypothetical protein [Candidatus Nealsonbacteria bacterium]